MVTHDLSVARAAHRILRIEDGVIKMALTPSEVIVEEKAVSYTDQLKARIEEINGQLLQLDKDFKASKVTGDEYTETRMKLKQTLGSLQEELSRMGMVTYQSLLPRFTVKSTFSFKWFLYKRAIEKKSRKSSAPCKNTPCENP